MYQLNMNVVYKGLTKLKSIYNQINPATLTGAIDIIVVEQPDGTLLASPFHVRFGKIGVLQTRHRVVNISINEEPVKDLQMKLGDQGEAFFVTDHKEGNIPPQLATSPFPTRPCTPTDGNSCDEKKSDESDGIEKKRRRKKRKRKDFHDNPHDFRDDQNLQESTIQVNRTSSPISNECSTIQEESYRNVVSDSELQENRSRENFCRENDKSENVKWGWGGLPNENHLSRDERGGTDDARVNFLTEINSNSKIKSSIDKNHDLTPDNDGSLFKTISTQKVQFDLEKDNCIKESSTKEEVIEVTNPVKKLNKNVIKTKKKSSGPLYLTEIDKLGPSQADLYLKVKKENEQSITIVNSSEQIRNVSPGCSDVDSGTGESWGMEISEQWNLDQMDISASLCGLQANVGQTEDYNTVMFDEERLSYEKFQLDPTSYLTNEKLVIKINRKYYTWKQAQPLLFSLLLFKRPLPETCISTTSVASQDSVQNSASPKKVSNSDLPNKGSWSWLFRRSSQQENIKSKDDKEVVDILQNEEKVKCADLKTDIEASKSDTTFEVENPNTISKNKKLMKTTRLTSSQLEDLKLHEGANSITFSVTTQYQGTKRCRANIYKWKWTDKIVVSDIDGTITKSDVFGQILPVVGKDWTQGGIANLYHNIGRNNYKFIYLSARAIGQASMTKDYLNWVNQHGVTLPPGPLLLSPSSLLTAFRREVIEKTPEKFKIACLKDIKSLFPVSEPFYAGFGNKNTDVISYKAVKIPKERMFTINHRGELVQEHLPRTYLTT